MEQNEILRNGGYLIKRQIGSRTNYYHLLQYVKEGKVVRVKRGVYALRDSLAKSMIDVEKIVPGGVICLYSAWSFYELTTQIPTAYNIAVEKSRKIKLPDDIPVEISYWSKVPFQLGVTEQCIDGFQVKIYDLEKSVCDAIKFRNKIGIDVSSEILRNYLHRPDRNLNKLNKYAAVMRVKNTLDNLIGYMI